MKNGSGTVDSEFSDPVLHMAYTSISLVRVCGVGLPSAVNPLLALSLGGGVADGLVAGVLRDDSCLLVTAV